MFHQTFGSNIWIVNGRHSTVYHFCQVVWQHIGGHADSNARSAIDQKVWDTGR
jgi:hypothetical protein